MPNLADFTVKKYDGTTDITWFGVIAASGDGAAALLRSTTVGASPAFNPNMSIVSSGNSNGSVRRIKAKAFYPQVALGADGVYRIVNTALFDGTWVLPQAMPMADLREFCYQVPNLMYKDTFKEVLRLGVSLT